MSIISKIIAPLVGAGFTLFVATQARSAEEFNNLTCVIELKTEQPCNISIHKRAMVIKFPNGRTNRVRLSKIRRWAYTNQSELKGFIFTWVKHRHVFGISFRNIDGDTEQMAVAFDDSQYVQPFTFFLEGTGPAFD
jgi:hypothetical protein